MHQQIQIILIKRNLDESYQSTGTKEHFLSIATNEQIILGKIARPCKLENNRMRVCSHPNLDYNLNKVHPKSGCHRLDMRKFLSPTRTFAFTLLISTLKLLAQELPASRPFLSENHPPKAPSVTMFASCCAYPTAMLSALGSPLAVGLSPRGMQTCPDLPGAEDGSPTTEYLIVSPEPSTKAPWKEHQSLSQYFPWKDTFR